MQNNDSGDATAITVEQLPVFSQSDVAETSDEASSVLSFSSACADSEEQRNASPSFTVSVDGDAIDDKGDACCRICLEAIHASDFDSGSAIRLGCKYTNHLSQAWTAVMQMSGWTQCRPSALRDEMVSSKAPSFL